MKKSLENLISEIPVFSKFNQRETDNIHRSALRKEYLKGEWLAYQGDVWPYMFVLEAGVINVQKLSPEGRSLGAWRLSTGQVFWSPSLFDEEPLPAGLEARETSKIYLWHSDHLLPIVRNNNLAMWDLCVLLTERMRRASEVVEDLAFHPVSNRLARLLVNQYEDPSNILVERSLTLDEMATMIGSTPVMVCKILSRFADQGMIKISRTEFEFIDRGKLTKIAGHE
jgi:CRP/FNR family transcriptional regulator